MAFKMNRPIIKGTPLQKKTGNNSDDLRRNIGGNTLGLKDRGELEDWYASNVDKVNFGYSTYEDFSKDWPKNYGYEEYGRATTMEGGPDYFRKVKPEKTIKLSPRPIEQLPTSEMGELKQSGIDIDQSKYKYSKYYDPYKKEYRVRVIDKSKKGKSGSEIDNLSLDMFEEMYKQ